MYSEGARVLVLLCTICFAYVLRSAHGDCADSRTAVCFYGQLRALEEGQAQNLLNRLVKPLCGDVFIVAQDDPDFSTKVGLFGDALKSYEKQPSRGPDDMNRLIEEAGGNVTAMFSLKGGTLWLGGLRNPMDGTVAHTSTAHVALRWSTCMHVISDWERRHRVNRPYEFVSMTRTDLHWVFPHPRVDAFNPSDAWTFNRRQTHIAEGMRGITDHHFLVNRTAAGHIFNPLWHRYSTGSILNTSWSHQLHDAERLLESLFKEEGLRISEFPTGAALVCQQNASSIGMWSPCGSLDWHSQSGFFTKVEMEGIRQTFGSVGIKSRRPISAKYVSGTLRKIQRTFRALKKLKESELAGMYSIEELLSIANETIKGL